MFQRAYALLKQNIADRAVCLMDIADDWKMQFNLDAYKDTYDTAIWFAKKYPDTLWCYGNHDACYLWNQRETGYSKIAPKLVCDKLAELKEALPDKGQLAFIHRIDRVLFMHGGLSEDFALYAEGLMTDDYVCTAEEGQDARQRLSTDELIERINGYGYGEMWNDDSPLWLRPQYRDVRMYKKNELLQVVGHTPVKQIIQTGNVVSCDTFSLDRDRNPVGSQTYLLINTETCEWEPIS